MIASGPLKLAVTGVVFVLLVTGLGLASNTFLDRAGIADRAGLTVEARKEKAHRNQLEWEHRIIRDQ